MERIGFLINKLKEQYEKADSNEGMLVTLQMLYRELLPKMYGTPMLGNVSVVVPGQMDLSFFEKNIEDRFTLDLIPNTNGKLVYELPVAPVENVKPIEIKPIVEEKPKTPLQNINPPDVQNVAEAKPVIPIESTKPIEIQSIAEAKPIDKPLIAVVEPAKNPFIITTPKVEIPVFKPEPVVEEKAIEEPKKALPEVNKNDFFEVVNSRFMPQEEKLATELPVAQEPIIISPPTPLPLPPTAPKVETTVVPPKEIHETIQENRQPSLNDKAEKRQPEIFHTFKAEPLKDLKKAISINERFQYINHLFMKDETMYDRSLKTINSFNVISEAKFWIKKELAIKMGWSDDDEIVQQFMHLVERRFL